MDGDYFKIVEEASSAALRVVSRSVAIGVLSVYVLSTMMPGVLPVVAVSDVLPAGMVDVASSMDVVSKL